MNRLTKKEFKNARDSYLKHLEEIDSNNDPDNYDYNSIEHDYDYESEMSSNPPSTQISPKRPKSKSKIQKTLEARLEERPINTSTKNNRFKKKSNGELVKKITNRCDLKTIKLAFDKVDEELESEEIQYKINMEGNFELKRCRELEKEYKEEIFKNYFDDSFDEKKYLKRKKSSEKKKV